MGDIAEIIPLINSNSGLNVESIKEKEMNDPFIKRFRVKKSLILLAVNECGDIYYWDSNDGRVYICFSADENENGMEIPYYIC